MISTIFEMLWGSIDSAWNNMRVIFLNFGVPAEVLIVGFAIISGLLFCVIKPFVGQRRHFK